MLNKIKTPMKKTIHLTLLMSLLLGCSPKIATDIVQKRQALTIEDKVAFLDLYNKVPEGSEKLGSAKFGDTGLSTDCGFDENLVKARKIARQNGANIVKVTQKKTPDLWSSCYRLEIDFYYYPGDVTQLQQYQIQIN